MTREEAIRILDPETMGETLAEIEYYGGFRGRTKAAQALSDACILAAADLREQEERRWIPVTERLPENGGYVVCIAKRNPFSRFMPMVARIEKNGWVNPMTEQYISEVTHWAPLPPLPKGE